MSDTAAEQPLGLGQEGRDYPETVPLILLADQVIFPMTLVPLKVTGTNEVKLLDDAAVGPRYVGIVALRDAENDNRGPENAYEVGCLGRIMQLQHSPENQVSVVIQAMKRFRVAGVLQREPYPVVKVQVLEDEDGSGPDMDALVAAVKNQVTSLIRLSPNIPDEAANVVRSIEDGGFLADLVTSNLAIPPADKQKILETLNRKDRLERLAHVLGREIEMLEISQKIQHDVRSSIDKSQREYFLREQLKAIQGALGEGEKDAPEIKDYREKINALGLPEEAKKEALRELDRLGQMNEASAEYHVITTYLDWIIELPWRVSTEDQLDIGRAEDILNADHYGLSKVKKRILEYLAVRKLKPDAAGPILCFVGPPGVGKTSLGASIARALGRKFIRMSLGGMRDEAEIRGHRKTYVGAMPGRIIQSMRKVQSNNPVFMLDEIDKVGSDFRGDPSSALLEVLDPAQNATFADLYLGVAFDLSKVMFIATANVLDTIPWALRDRMEIIEIPGYTLEEKLQIARKYLVPRQLDANGIPKGKLAISIPSLRKIITGYTREAGVRNLEREIGNVCRSCARGFAEGRRKPVRVGPKDVRTYLGNEKIGQDVLERTRVPGVAVGMAWTPVGGDILFIEASRMPGKGNLVLTGQLGDVMKESAQAVISYVRSNAKALGIAEDDFSKLDIHIHVPAGAVPKDGPSAGVTILTAVVSLLSGKKVKKHLAMTGEITLRGLVLPVGGIKEKVLAASRAGITEIILPARNKNDLDDVPPSVKKKTKFHPVSHMKDVLTIALGLAP